MRTARKAADRVRVRRTGGSAAVQSRPASHGRVLGVSPSFRTNRLRLMKAWNGHLRTIRRWMEGMHRPRTMARARAPVLVLARLAGVDSGGPERLPVGALPW